MEFFFYSLEVGREADNQALKEELLNLSNTICIVDLQKILCKNQVLSALHRATHAFSEGNNLAKVWGIEVTLELLGTTQIKQAINFFDISASTKTILIISQEQLNHETWNLVKGFPQIPEVDESLLISYGISDQHNYCSKIISKAATMRV